ncbi:MAG: dipicolinate synthase subunit B [Erysipelotrichaceae bacterium]|nr:dipicolinate synthase subunit B [Erysipelotrichaceae bacterium]
MRLGVAITGSFCSMDDLLYVLEELKNDYDIDLFMSDHVDMMDTRFNSAQELKDKIYQIISCEIHHTINEAEIYGPNHLLDALLIYPCSSNTLAKLALGINDNVITMLVKSCLRNAIPIIIGIYSNDVLSLSGKHLLTLYNRKNYYIVPIYQDNYKQKPNSVTACKEKVKETIREALNHQQIQPFLLGYKKM